MRRGARKSGLFGEGRGDGGVTGQRMGPGNRAVWRSMIVYITADRRKNSAATRQQERSREMREITVRAAQRRDAAELAALNRAFNGATGTCGADEMAALLEEPAEQVLVAVVDGAVAGFICGHVWRSICYPDIQGEIKELYIGSDYRRLGLGQRLMAAMEQYLRGRGVRAVTLFTGLQNTAAQAFYERCGYTDQQQMEYEKKL